MQYFDHSTNAATDPKIMQLRLEHGGAAVDAYWYLVEQMHRDERPLCVCNASVMRVHCHTLCVDFQTLEKWVGGMVEAGLFHMVVHNGERTGEITSERVEENIGRYQAKQEKARSAAESRWGNADAKQTQCKRNANAMPTKQIKTKQNKTNNKAASPVAAAAKAAPNEAGEESKAPHCPLCDVLLKFDPKTAKWKCPNCLDDFEGSKVVWR